MWFIISKGPSNDHLCTAQWCLDSTTKLWMILIYYIYGQWWRSFHVSELNKAFECSFIYILSWKGSVVWDFQTRASKMSCMFWPCTIKADIFNRDSKDKLSEEKTMLIQYWQPFWCSKQVPGFLYIDMLPCRRQC